MQRPEWLFPGLRARPWHDPGDLRWTGSLEEAAPRIRAEVLSLFRDGTPALHPAHGRLVGSGAWRAEPLLTAKRRFEDVLARCPATRAIVDAIPGRTPAGLVYVSVLEPRTRVLPHCGPTNLRLRCHLPLVAPAGCTLRVADERRALVEGRCLVFDDSFEHEAENPAGRSRIVLVVDVWHPDLTESERSSLAETLPRFAELDRQRRAAVERPLDQPIGALAAFAAAPMTAPASRRPRRGRT